MKDGLCFACEVKETPNMGLGVFCCEPIPKGAIVWRHLPGQFTVYDEQSFRDVIGKMSHEEAVYELTHVLAYKEFPDHIVRIHDAGALMNHSDNANLAVQSSDTAKRSYNTLTQDFLQEADTVLLDDRFSLIATRDITSGEELTTNYKTDIADDPPYYEDLYEQYGIEEDYLDD